jgi:hypothetical protein
MLLSFFEVRPSVVNGIKTRLIQSRYLASTQIIKIHRHLPLSSRALNFFARPTQWWKWPLKPLQVVPALLATIVWFVQWLVLDVLLGDGYAKVRPLLLFLVMLFACGWFYHRAAEQSAFVPTNPVLYNDPEVRKACAGTQGTPDVTAPIDWYSCKNPPTEFSPFRPWIYSVDLMIPFIQLGQKRDWQPISRELQFDTWGAGQLTLPGVTTLVVMWSQIVASLLLYLFIAAILGGLIKRD